MLRVVLAWALALGWCSLPAAAADPLYQWVDSEGGVHFTEDLAEVPPDQRPRADQDMLLRNRQPARYWNTLETPPPAAPAARAVRLRGAPSKPSEGRVHTLITSRAGHEIRLNAELDNQVMAAFIADTGASLNTIPKWAASELGVVVDEDTPVMTMVGVGGKPMTVPMITLDSVRVGSAVVRDVEMAVVDTMSTGLLGMPFFNKITTMPIQAVPQRFAVIRSDSWSMSSARREERK